MSKYQKLQENLEKLKLTQLKLHLDDYIDKINEQKLSITDALFELTEKELEISNCSSTFKNKKRYKLVRIDIFIRI